MPGGPLEKEMPVTTTEADSPYPPTPRDMIMLQVPMQVAASPAGAAVAVLMRTTNWRDNRYEQVCHIYDVAHDRLRQLTYSGSVEQVEWLDEDHLALLKKLPEGDGKPQIWIYDAATGEGWPLTDHETGVSWFTAFGPPDFPGILYCAAHPDREKNKARTDQYGRFVHLEQEESASALYYMAVEEMRCYQRQSKALTEDEARELVKPVIELSQLLEGHPSIQSAIASPTGDVVYVNCRSRDDLVYYRETFAYAIRFDPRAALAEYRRRETAAARAKARATSAEASGEKAAEEAPPPTDDASYLGQARRLSLPRLAAVDAVSPDGRQLLIRYPGRDEKMYTQEELWVVDATAAESAQDAAAARAALTNVSSRLDQWVLTAGWAATGIYGAYVEGTRGRIARFAEDGQVTPLDLAGLSTGIDFRVSASGYLGFIASGPDRFLEAYLAAPAVDGDAPRLVQLTHCAAAVANWSLGTVETIRWTSRDGIEIEGVLHKPANFDPARKYPLVFVVHGGPTWASFDDLVNYEDIAYYPTIQFANRDILVLKPNYRGSIGRGQAFVELNVNNLGVGDLWDLETAIEHLVQQGIVDPARVGCMGWSQGGYISAFAGLQSDAFKAVSVGAGISDWYTYHISNDIPDFTTDFLSGSPFRSRESYIKTAPISNLGRAHTPMLIQHGSEDRRVPFSNAMELYRGLKEMGVPVELIVFPGMSHSIRKPRENHALMCQNLSWFSHYLLGEELTLG